MKSLIKQFGIFFILCILLILFVKVFLSSHKEAQSSFEDFCNNKYTIGSSLHKDCVDCLTQKIKPTKNILEKGGQCLLTLQDYSGLKNYDKDFLNSEWYKKFVTK